ncbi:pancreatic triacylglycerol lipase-like [Dermacentor andersoni]|uniref:pancreatic triacylglycerol lipase-like n=1 Tax=Dermacentor andersoni TaxID=34620 RepID=UPI003B3B2C0A
MVALPVRIGAVVFLCNLVGAGITEHATKLLRRTLGGTPSVSSKCMRGLGCFENDDIFYHVIHRPINVLPDDRERISTRFLLFTKRNPNEPELLSADGMVGPVEDSFFNGSLKTKVIVHGFMDSQEVGKWMVIMKDEFLKHDDYNVIVVDWSRGNGPPYTKATANTRVVGAELALLISTLQNATDASPADFHIIGHSLGAQIAGYAGERIDKIGRITGLDPAGPYFFHMPPAVRLDPTDAAFVDVIHSDASLPFSIVANLGFGIDQLVGHVDFYPNNGNRQPGCRMQHINSLLLEGMLESVRRLAACDHQRSVDYFIATINRRLCLPVGVACRSWEEFTAGRCGGCASGRGRCAVMGFLADKVRRLPRRSGDRTRGNSAKLYLKTDPDPPYCLFQYQIIVKTTKSVPLWDLFGDVQLTLPGVDQKIAIRMHKSPHSMKPGVKYTSLLTTKKRLFDVHNVTFHWKSLVGRRADSESLGPVPRILYFKIRPLDMHVLSKRTRRTETWRFCRSGVKGIPLVPGELVLEPQEQCGDDDDEVEL